MITQTRKISIAVPFRGARGLVLALTAVVLIGLLARLASAQELPDAPSKAATTTPYLGDYDWLYRAGVVCGTGSSNSSITTKPTAQCGGVFGLGLLDIEAGVMGPQASRSAVSGYLSTNAWIPLIPLRDFGKKHGAPVFVGGYTRMFETGHAVDYGFAYDRQIDESHLIQFEARDYWAFSGPSQHNVIFRIAWLLCIPDP